MNSKERREAILQYIQKSDRPLSASALASRFHVSRQLIVGDVALLRAGGKQILSTPRGYMCEAQTHGIKQTIAVSHSRDQLEDEILTVIDLGGSLIDVMIDHPLYGELVGMLHISSRYDAFQFFDKLKNEDASPLCDLTNGLHLHTIACKDEASYQRILEALEKKGYLWKS